MREIRVILFVLLISCGRSWAVDEFDGIKCGADIPKALSGKRAPNERVVVLEGRYKDLALKDLGGTEISDRLFLNSWLICGVEYAILTNTAKNLIQDVLAVPAHSLRSPLSFAEGCQIAGKKIPEAVIAILDNSQGQRPKEYLARIALPAKLAWKIEERQERFVPIATQNLTCEVGGDSAEFKP